MHVMLLGTGVPPPNPKRRGAPTFLTLGDQRLLVDADSGVGAQLLQAGLRPYDWPRVFMTHHHAGLHPGRTAGLGNPALRWAVRVGEDLMDV
jgi:ribonuclease BN (tRNA processing enzyme)